MPHPDEGYPSSWTHKTVQNPNQAARWSQLKRTFHSYPGTARGIGRIGSDGTVYGSSGWTCSHAVTGYYTITHNLGLDPLSYIVLAMLAEDPPAAPEPPAPGQQPAPRAGTPPSIIPMITEQTADTFTLKTVQGGTLNPIDWGFNFAIF
jgi:hypothetical protein